MNLVRSSLFQKPVVTSVFLPALLRYSDNHGFDCRSLRTCILCELVQRFPVQSPLKADRSWTCNLNCCTFLNVKKEKHHERHSKPFWL